MSTRIKYASLRHHTWIYRRTYPQHLQGVLGTALKRSLKTSDARTAKARVEELNATFTQIVMEAEAHALRCPVTSDAASCEADRLDVALPRHRRLRLVGDRRVSESAEAYLAEASERLRPGSYKSVRFAIELLVSQLGQKRLSDITQAEGQEVLRLIAKLSPNVRKYRAAKGRSLTELSALSRELEPQSLMPQTQRRIWEQMSGLLDWALRQGELSANPWDKLEVMEAPEPEPHRVLTDPQVALLVQTQDRALHGALLFGLLTGLRSGEICGLMTEDIVSKGNLGRFLRVRPNAHRLLKSKAAEREVPLHTTLEAYLDKRYRQLPSGRLFPGLSVDKVVKGYAKLRQRHPELQGTVFHSTRKWFVTQCERTGVPEHFTASLVGHHSARSQNGLTYGLYSAGISDTQKREIIDQLRLPEGVTL